MSDEDRVLLKRSTKREGRQSERMPLPSEEEDLVTSRLLHPGGEDQEPVRLLIVTSGFGRTRGKNGDICRMAA